MNKDEMAGHAKHMDEMRSLYNNFFGKTEWSKSLGRTRSRWKDNIKMRPNDMMVCIHLAQYWAHGRAHMKTEINPQILRNIDSLLRSLVTIGS
jgi:hypothetical protein